MSFTNSVMFSLGLSLVVLGANGNIASLIVPCHINDNACVLANAKKLMPLIAKGHEEYGSLSVDPMHFDHIDGNTGELELALHDLIVEGASQCTLERVDRPDKYTIILVALCPITANGKYTLKGKLFGFPLSGHDDFQFKTDNIKIEAIMTLKSYIAKDGEEHYKVAKFDYTYDTIGDVQLNFKNIEGGEHAEDINKLIKQSPKELMNTLGKPVLTEIIKKVVSVGAHAFSLVPANKIELE